MASSIVITPLSPYRALFTVSLDVGTAISFQRSGAVAPDMDVSSLAQGPLRAHLSRLASWATVATPAAGSRLLWRRVTGSLIIVPISGGTSTVDGIIIQNGPTSIAFTPNAGAGTMLLELVFLHSASQ